MARPEWDSPPPDLTMPKGWSWSIFSNEPTALPGAGVVLMFGDDGIVRWRTTGEADDE